MFKEIYKRIKKFDAIIIVRHIGVDPDALASQIALRDSIRLTFPEKKVYAWGNSSVKFDYFPKLDKIIEVENALLIVVDTPDKKRVDFNWEPKIKYSIKIDHHPYIEKFCDIELIDDCASSASELILELINSTGLKINKNIAETLFLGIVSDTNRFLFNSSTSKTFLLISNMLKKFDLDIQSLYKNLYMRPISEIRLQGYISQNMTITENGLGYIKLTNDILNKFQVDVGSAGNMVNHFNYINELLVWITVSQDTKNNIFKINIRSRGPIINSIAERYSGGGHKFASGARVPTMAEVDDLIEDLDRACELFIKEMDVDKNED